MVRKLLMLVAMVFFFTSMLQAAQIPLNEKELPVFPGAVRNSTEEAEIIAAEEGLHAAPMDTSDEHPLAMRSFSVFAYTVNTPAEKVLRFYLDKLGGKEEEASEHLYTGNTPSGSTSQVYYRIDFVDFTVYSQKDAAEAKAELEKARSHFESGNWVSSADFAWEVGEQNGDFSVFDLTVRDDYFYTFDARGNKKIQTTIVIRKTTYMNPDDARAVIQNFKNEGDAGGGSDQVNNVWANDGVPFNPEGVGVSVYPGSVYDAETTAFLRENMGLRAGAYQSGDNARNILSFFEKAGLKQIHADENGGVLKRCQEEYNPYLKKTMSTGECDVEITIQSPWRDMTTGELRQNTLISIVDTSE